MGFSGCGSRTVGNVTVIVVLFRRVCLDRSEFRKLGIIFAPFSTSQVVCLYEAFGVYMPVCTFVSKCKLCLDCEGGGSAPNG